MRQACLIEEVRRVCFGWFAVPEEVDNGPVSLGTADGKQSRYQTVTERLGNGFLAWRISLGIVERGSHSVCCVGHKAIEACNEWTELMKTLKGITCLADPMYLT
jgi:hypothetical protein